MINPPGSSIAICSLGSGTSGSTLTELGVITISDKAGRAVVESMDISNKNRGCFMAMAFCGLDEWFTSTNITEIYEIRKTNAKTS